MRVELTFHLKRALAVAIILSGFIGTVKADLATVHLTNGTSRTVELVSVNRGILEGKVNNRPDTPVEQFPRSRIAYVDFPTTEAWRDAEAAFQSGKFDEAIPLYRSVIADPAAHFFPMPGNYVSLAQVRILDCHRGRMVPADIAEQAQVVREQWLNLPPSYRVVDPVVSAWKAVADKDWDKVISSLEGLDPPTPESYFLNGVALEALDRSEEAMQQYAGAYVLNFGGVSNLSKQSLKRSAQLLIALKNKDRTAELQAQVKLYRDLFGGGKLWEGVPEWVVKLADAELDALKTEVEGEFEKPGSAMEGGAVVTSSGAAATIPPIEERDWILPDEVDHRFQIFGTDPANNPLILKGGAVEADEGIRFDGSGVAQLAGINGAADAWRLQMQFRPETSEGIVLHFSDGKAGLRFQIKAGQLILHLTPSRGGKKTTDLGPVPTGSLANVVLVIRPDGKIIAVLNGNKAEFAIRARSFRLKGRPMMFVGNENPAAKGAEGQIPFKGLVSLVTLGSGKTHPEILSDEKLAFAGKQLRFTPPEIKPESAPETEDPPSKPEVPAEPGSEAKPAGE